jgi:hypothetical protein
MGILIMFISTLLKLSGGIIALVFVLLFLAALAIGAFRAYRILVALLHYSIAEPEAKLVREAQKLNILSAKKKKSAVLKINPEKMQRPLPWPPPPPPKKPARKRKK